jgi:putative flavoprotein involved in K+ transport
VSEQPGVIVVGGGQAGLSAGYYLRQAEVPFLILDAASRGGDSWRARWDSLVVFTSAAYSELPGLPFPGDRERFPGKDEVADYLETYARKFELPVRHDARVVGLERRDGGYRLRTESDILEAGQVIVATGAYQNPSIPPIADGLSEEVTQLHSAAYRNPAQIPAGTVLIVGSANSGCQIATDLQGGDHQVHLARGRRLPTLPYRILGKSLHWWGDKLGLIAAPLEGSLRGRTQRGDLLVGTSPRQVARRHGVKLHARAVAADGTTVCFADERTLQVDTVIWATGYHSDYSWIHAPLLDEHGQPRHRRGVTDAPGLYFLGMHNQYSRGSSLIYFVKEDAAHIVEQVRSCSSASDAGMMATSEPA